MVEFQRVEFQRVWWLFVVVVKLFQVLWFVFVVKQVYGHRVLLWLGSLGQSVLGQRTLGQKKGKGKEVIHIQRMKKKKCFGGFV